MSTADDYKPGDLAWGTVNRKRDTLLLRINPMTRSLSEPWLVCATGHKRMNGEVTDLRPAYVLGPDERAVPKGGVWLDPEDDCAGLARAILEGPRGVLIGADILHRALRTLAAAQSEPPLEEPGLWGVVEASRNGSEFRRRWVTYGNGVWQDRDGTNAIWTDLTDPTLVRPGVDDAHDAGGPARDGQAVEAEGSKA